MEAIRMQQIGMHDCSIGPVYLVAVHLVMPVTRVVSHGGRQPGDARRASMEAKVKISSSDALKQDTVHDTAYSSRQPPSEELIIDRFFWKRKREREQGRNYRNECMHSQVCWLLDLFPQGGGQPRARHAGHLPGAPVREGGAVCAHQPA
jgi:hypothetical protein